MCMVPESEELLSLLPRGYLVDPLEQWEKGPQNKLGSSFTWESYWKCSRTLICMWTRPSRCMLKPQNAKSSKNSMIGFSTLVFPSPETLRFSELWSSIGWLKLSLRYQWKMIRLIKFIFLIYAHTYIVYAHWLDQEPEQVVQECLQSLKYFVLAFQTIGSHLAWWVGDGTQVKIGEDAIMGCNNNIFLAENIVLKCIKLAFTILVK